MVSVECDTVCYCAVGCVRTVSLTVLCFCMRLLLSVSHYSLVCEVAECDTVLWCVVCVECFTALWCVR